MFSPLELNELFEDNHGHGLVLIPGLHEVDSSFLSHLIKPKFVVKNITDFDNIVVLGVHGWDLFPWISRMFYKEEEAFLSTKFCEYTKNSLIKFYSEHFPNKEYKITSIPLKGHGLIEERVSLYKRILHKYHKKVLSEADLIIIATHSQGVPVSFLLFDELCQDKIVNLQKQRIGMISMAGLHHGTLYNPYGMGFIGVMYQRATKELYLMRDHTSLIFLKYIESVKKLLAQGMIVACFANYSDSVVDLYSSMMEMFESPNILRALYVHKSIYQEFDKNSKLILEEDDTPQNPNEMFFVSLVLFCIKLRNLGFYQHPMLKFISELNEEVNLASHTMIHQERSVYDKGIEWILQQVPKNENPIIREIKDEPQRDYLVEIPELLIKAKSQFPKDFIHLRILYKYWNPTLPKQIALKKALKDIFALQSKL
jgi:hypothetical protein